MRFLRFIFMIAAVYLLSVLLLTVAYRTVRPVTPLMVAARLTGHMQRRWVPLHDISPALIRTVLLSEDARFCAHSGIDWHSVDRAIDDADRRRGGPRGASTIDMQVAKNLFFWPGRSYLRKALEAPVALWIDRVLPKRRILEIYLNIAEWGDGVFGIEAAAEHEFGVHASQLNEAQAAMLVVMLPDPEHRSASHPGFGHIRLSFLLMQRMAREGIATGCLRH